MMLTANTDIPEVIRSSPKFFPFFADVQRAIDGTHILLTPPAADSGQYHNWKGQTTQNILASCTPNLQFRHILASWEGSAFDSAIFADARRNDFIVSPWKLFLQMQASLFVRN